MICNEEGIDPISFGATIGAVMELYEMGVLSKEQIGIEAPFGSAQALAFLVEETVNGRGFGKEIGQGSKRLTAKYGHPDLSMSSKGQEFPAYDGRGIQGIGLAYATSNRGGCHLRGYTIASEVLGIPVKTDPLEHEGKPELVKAFQDATAAFDSSGLCVFTTFAWGLADLAPQLQAAMRRAVHHRGAGKDRRAHLEHGARVQQRRRLHRQGRQPAQAPADRSRQDRPGQGQGQHAGRDDAQVLRRPRLGQRRPPHRRDPDAPGPVERRTAPGFV
jgi:aldehyde:ferredoxin oxidoreductase